MTEEAIIIKAKSFCNEMYRKLFDDEYQKLINIHKEEERVRSAQKTAIQKTFYHAISKFPKIEAALLWDAIYGAHVHRRTKIDDTNIIEIVISAAQSWRKSSGHAFEEFIKDNVSKALKGTPLKIVLQRDLNQMIQNGTLGNEKRDIDWLSARLQSDTFDLYVLVEQKHTWKCFGCVQSKTSISDRVTRDREPSIAAMKQFFWSVCITLDGAFLKLPKFKGMVNGGINEFPENGWNGMYVLSNVKQADRIYPVDLSFTIFKKHALEAAKAWIEQRQWLTREWKASEK